MMNVVDCSVVVLTNAHQYKYIYVSSWHSSTCRHHCRSVNSLKVLGVSLSSVYRREMVANL